LATAQMLELIAMTILERGEEVNYELIEKN